MRPCGDARTLEQRRLKAVELCKEGLGPGAIAGRLGVNRRSVHRWLASYRSRGIAGLAPLPTPGRPPRLTLGDRQKLADLLLGAATTHGYPSDRWTNARVADLIRRRFGVAYHVNHIGRLLRRLQASVILTDDTASRENSEKKN